MTSTFKRLPDSELFHVVLDLETLDVKPNAAITEVAIVQVDSGTATFWEIDPTTIIPEMSRNPKTLQWHEEQRPGYLERLTLRGQRWAAVMDEVSLHLNNLASNFGKPVCIWCQGTDFDIPVLKENLIAASTGVFTLPWNYCYVRDIRTLAGAYPEIKYEKGSHSALDDATKAAAHLRKIAFADPRIAQMLGIPHA